MLMMLAPSGMSATKNETNKKNNKKRNETKLIHGYACGLALKQGNNNHFPFLSEDYSILFFFLVTVISMMS